MNPEVKALINSVAKELNLNVSDVERAYEAPFDLQAIVMKYRCDRDKQIFPSLRIPYFLIFYCPTWNKKRLLKKWKKDEIVL
jgi:hypothetical protein